MKKKIKLILFLVFVIALAFLVFFFNSASKTDAQVDSAPNVSGAAVIYNTGDLIYFSGTNGGTTGNISYNVNYNNGSFSGYAWSPEYGWIQFNGTSANILSFQNDSESPSWANGLIKLNGTDGGSTNIIGIPSVSNPVGVSANISYSVVFNPTTGIADSVNHWAWGGNVLGWIDFSGVTVSGETDLCPTINGIQTVYPCGPCPNYPTATSIPNGMIIDSDTGNCVTPGPNEPTLSASTNGLTTIVWSNAENCVPIPNVAFPEWSDVDLNDYGTLSLEVLTTTVFSMNCNGNIISVPVCILGTPTPAGVICKKPPHYIED